jgi:hypothetical protein
MPTGCIHTAFRESDFIPLNLQRLVSLVTVFLLIVSINLQGYCMIKFN